MNVCPDNASAVFTAKRDPRSSLAMPPGEAKSDCRTSCCAAEARVRCEDARSSYGSTLEADSSLLMTHRCGYSPKGARLMISNERTGLWPCFGKSACLELMAVPRALPLESGAAAP